DATVNLAWALVMDLVTAPVGLLTVTEMLDVFGSFMIVLIGLELMETVKTYITEKRIHVEAVLTVAMIAVTRKLIILDIKDISAPTLFAVAAIIVALAAGYYLMRLPSGAVTSPDDAEIKE